MQMDQITMPSPGFTPIQAAELASPGIPHFPPLSPGEILPRM